MKAVKRLGSFAAALLLADLAASAGPAQSMGAMWKPIEQPQLAAAWAAAPQLKFEELADGPDVCTEGPIWWVANPDGKSWDIVFVYDPSYGGPNQVFIYDPGTKELKKSACPEFVKAKVGFHLSNFFLINGKAYIAEVIPVGKMEDAPLAFLDGDVYVAGSAKFRKIAGLPKVTADKSQK